MQERLLHQKVKRLFEKAGWLVRKIKYEGRNGCPDLLLVSPVGNLHLAELKQEKGRLSPSQEREHEHLRGQGYHVPIVRSVEAAAALLSRLEGEDLL